jgi:hypothetical protein
MNHSINYNEFPGFMLHSVKMKIVAPYKALQPLHSKVLALQAATIFCH